MNDTRVLCLKQTKVTLLPKKSTMKIQLRRSHLIQKNVRMVKKESKGFVVVQVDLKIRIFVLVVLFFFPTTSHSLLYRGDSVSCLFVF